MPYVGRNTTYRFLKEEDGAAVEKLWDATDIPKFPTSFPEIVAERDSEIIGFVAIHHNQECVLVEPMLCQGPATYWGLWHALEAIFKSIGVTSYSFRLEPHRVAHERLANSRVKK
ncbi:hypothetical protein LCGC14_3141370, partial [marine sediment metagenome]